jgi:hypothetical protein
MVSGVAIVGFSLCFKNGDAALAVDRTPSSRPALHIDLNQALVIPMGILPGLGWILLLINHLMSAQTCQREIVGGRLQMHDEASTVWAIC